LSSFAGKFNQSACSAWLPELGAEKPRIRPPWFEKIKAGIRAKVEHPFRVIKCQFGFTKVRYRGLAKNTARLSTLFALSNLWLFGKHLLHGPPGRIRTTCLEGL